MGWSYRSSRAVFPSDVLQASDAPVLADKKVATSSPLPFGLGVYQRNEAGEGIAQKLFYVSPRVAKARGRGVLPGWYVVATPDTTFWLRFTNVHKSGRGFIRGEPLESERGASAEIFVDGINPLGSNCSCYATRAGKEYNIEGFRDSKHFEVEKKDRRGKKDNRVRIIHQFRFQKKDTSEFEGEEDNEMGSLTIHIFSGRYVPWQETDHHKESTAAPSKTVGKVREKSAVKLGRSIQVERGEILLVERGTTSDYSLKREKLEGVVKIYMREKYWLESRCIIDSDGNTFKPNRSEAVIELTESISIGVNAENENMGTETGNVKKRGSVKHESCVSKKVKLEVIDLTLVKDEIDLTE